MEGDPLLISGLSLQNCTKNFHILLNFVLEHGSKRFLEFVTIFILKGQCHDIFSRQFFFSWS
jgi:hypothetical protein